MPIFFYDAKTIDGQIKKGFLEATDTKELAQSLREKGLFLFKVDSKDKKENKILNFNLFHQKVPISEKMLMTRNLWIMITTGLPLVKGFSILSEQSKNKRMKSALSDIGQQIGQGISLSETLKKYPDIFSELYCSMVQVGEESGTLDESLSVLALQLEKEKEMRAKVKNALIYPVVLIVVMFIVGICLSLFVLPKLNTLFAGLNAELPITTKIILGSGNFFLKYWYIALLGIISLIILFSILIKMKPVKIFLDGLFLKIPVISSFIKKANSAYLIRSLSSLLSSGVPLLKSLEITSGTVNNYYFKHALSSASKEVEKGSQLYVALQPHKNIFPFGLIEIVEIGEETGKTSLILKKLAEFYEEEVSNMAQNLSVIIEPALIVVIGVVVGVFAVSIISPLYSSLQNI